VSVLTVEVIINEANTYPDNRKRTRHQDIPGQCTASLLDEGATVPFIARYRKEATGTLDEVAVAAVRTGLTAQGA